LFWPETNLFQRLDIADRDQYARIPASAFDRGSDALDCLRFRSANLGSRRRFRLGVQYLCRLVALCGVDLRLRIPSAERMRD